MALQKQNLNFRVKPEFVAELNSVAKTLEVPASQIVREAVREKLAELKRTHPLLSEKPEVAVQA